MTSSSLAPSTFAQDDEGLEDCFPLILENNTQQDHSVIRPPPDIYHILVLSSGFGTLQLVFALLASYGSAQLLAVGVSQAATGLIWLAGPLAGTLVQPLVGIISDRFGHQKFIVGAGLIGLVVSLLGLGWAPDTTEQMGGLSSALMVLFIITLNIAVQLVQLGLRVLIIETSRPDQQTTATAWTTRMIALGNILAQLAGSVDTTKLQPYMTGNHFKNLCLLTSFGLVNTLIALVLFVTSAQRKSVLGKPSYQHGGLAGLWKIIHTVSPGVISVWKVQAFSWMGWFSFLYYGTTYIDYIALSDLLQATTTGMGEEGQRNNKTKSLEFGSRAMLINASVSFISSVLIPLSFNTNADKQHNHGDVGIHSRTISKIRAYMTLSKLWMLSQLLFGVCMICTLWVSSVVGATCLVGVLGLSWFCTGWIPFALISTKVAQDSCISLYHSSPTGDGGDSSGLMMSLHNVSIAAPQILAGLLAGLIFWVSRDEGDNNQAKYVLSVGGIFGLGAAWMTRSLNIEQDL